MTEPVRDAEEVRRHTPTEQCPRTHPIILGCAICLAEFQRRRAEMAECELEDLRRHIDGEAGA